MNKVYRIVWSRALNALVAVSELASSAGKGGARQGTRGKRPVIGMPKMMLTAIRGALALGVAGFAFPALGATCGAHTCDVVITINANNTVSVDTSSYGSGDPEDPAILVINNSVTTVNSINLGGTPGNGAFYDDSDGLYGGGPNGNSYETALATFAMSTTDQNANAGTVTFTNGLQTGQSTYFSLESLSMSFNVQTLTSPSIPGLFYSLMPSIDTAKSFYLSSELAANTVYPIFNGGTLKLDGTPLTPYSFTISQNGGVIDLAGQSAEISAPIADATPGTPGGLSITNSGSGGALTLSGRRLTN